MSRPFSPVVASNASFVSFTRKQTDRTSRGEVTCRIVWRTGTATGGQVRVFLATMASSTTFFLALFLALVIAPFTVTAGAVPATFATVLDVPAWHEAVATGEPYAPPDFAKIHFIHCSRLNQTAWVLNRFYAANTSAPTALIEAAAVTAPVRMVNSVPGMSAFPHIMGKLNTNAVPKVITLTRAEGQAWNYKSVCAQLGGC